MRALIFIVIFYASNLCVSQQVLKGIAINIYDGDTFTLIDSDRQEIRIRVSGIDAPEMNQEYGIEARDYARSLLQGHNLTVYLEPGETYGRKLGVVVIDTGVLFNYEMVASGHAWFYDYFSDDKFLEAASQIAVKEGRGLWSNDRPEAPWEWRKKK